MDRVKVLFVDDETMVLNSIKRSVLDEDYSALFAVSGEKALEIMESEEISVLVTDMKMPNMNGLELLKKVKEISPDTIRIVLSGYTQLPQVLATVNSAGIFKFITKPWNDDEEFLPAIREALEYYNLKKESDQLKEKIEKKNIMYQNMLNYSNDILKNIKVDVNNIKTINRLIFNLQKNLLNKIKNNQIDINLVDYYVDLINSIYFDFLDTIPSKNEKFNLEQLAKSLKIDIISDSQVKFDKSDFEYEGNYSLIITITKTLLKELLNHCNENDFEIIIDKFDPLNISINFDKENFHEVLAKSLELKLIIMILNELSNTFGAKFSINIKDKLICLNTNLRSETNKN
ncbi:response regulator [Clostridium ganghwense]|uniref:Stage 0 sporulation protein A homolog n=1 Tax=Clostridium ganghwense TaxID=312089 RepID=A0ABT4CME8_9CLOT|nr:response regulator [Clostridium ganghwense]MCY6370221.1 response regulator [Clostridium ganghwense]